MLNILTPLQTFLSSTVLLLLFDHWLISWQILVTYWDIKVVLMFTKVTILESVSLRNWYSVRSNIYNKLVSIPCPISKNILFEWRNWQIESYQNWIMKFLSFKHFSINLLN